MNDPAAAPVNVAKQEARKLTEPGQTFQDRAYRPQHPAWPQQSLKAKTPVRSPDLNPKVPFVFMVSLLKLCVLVIFEQRLPVPADSVAVHCGEGEVTVQVKQDFLGNGQLIQPTDLTLGDCTPLDTTNHILLYQAELQACGSMMTMTDAALIYTFSLIYSPTPIHNTVILKTNPAEVVIECHYPRKQYVSSDAVMPTWKPFAFHMITEEQLHFSLRLMKEDWQSERPSGVYFLSDVMHIEASVLQGHHVPVRVYVDSCVASLGPDPNSQPRYPLISNHGCLTDAKLTGAKSYFMQRSQEDKLQFQLKAFRFNQDPGTSKLYITCLLKATTVSVPVDSQHKACSFLTEANRWVASGGDNKVCSCCETSCSDQRRWRRSPSADTDQQWKGEAALGPILVQDNVMLEEVTQTAEFPLEAPALAQTQELTPAASSLWTTLLCAAGAALGVVLLVFMIYCRSDADPLSPPTPNTPEANKKPYLMMQKQDT
ncbi:LOW QUALITY PROTEIN: zona pellucida sperm-binding protein 3-like [Diretmus argenteus]